MAAVPSKWISNRQLNRSRLSHSRYFSTRTAQDRGDTWVRKSRRCPRRCAADAQVRIVRRPVQNPKVCRLGQESRSTVRIRYSNSGLRGVVGAAPQRCRGPRCQAHDPRRGVIPNRRVARKVRRSRRRRRRSSAAPNLPVNFIASCRRRSPAGPTYSARRRRATPRLSQQGR